MRSSRWFAVGQANGFDAEPGGPAANQAREEFGASRPRAVVADETRRQLGGELHDGGRERPVFMPDSAEIAPSYIVSHGLARAVVSPLRVATAIIAEVPADGR